MAADSATGETLGVSSRDAGAEVDKGAEGELLPSVWSGVDETG